MFYVCLRFPTDNPEWETDRTSFNGPYNTREEAIKHRDMWIGLVDEGDEVFIVERSK